MRDPVAPGTQLQEKAGAPDVEIVDISASGEISEVESPPAIERVDIGEEAKDLKTYSDASLEQIDEENRIKAHWFREKIVVFLSTGAIVVILLVAVFQLWSDVAESQTWGRQILATILGFAAGAIFQADRKS